MHKPVLNIKGKIPNIVFMSLCDAKTALSSWDMEMSSLAVSRAVMLAEDPLGACFGLGFPCIGLSLAQQTHAGLDLDSLV